ncbi:MULTISPECIES: flagellar filament capping protein FliD [unclassified Modestobacter]
MSVSTGLISGIDYDTMITQLMQVEANPQTLLKNQLVAVQADATAYRAVNTRFEALRSAAAALQADTTWSATKASSSSTDVTASAGATAVAGSGVTFAVKQLAATQTMVSGAKWASATAPASGSGLEWPITITRGTTTVGTVDVAAGATLADAVTAINAKSTELGVKASLIQVGTDDVRLQLTATTGGKAGVFGVSGAGTSTAFLTTAAGQDAELSLGGGLVATSSTNTFTDLLPGVTITAAKADPTGSVTVTVADDTAAAAAKMQSLVDAANSLFESITAYTSKDSQTASLKGDTTLRSLGTQILSIVSSGVGGKSASTIGLELTKTGTLTFDKAAFTAALSSDPAGVQDMLAKKTMVNPGVDGIAGNADDTTLPVGLAAQLEVLAKKASDSATGTLTMLASSSDSTAKDLTARIESWDTRLALRKDALTRQFTAMETALSTLQNQGQWLSSQLAGLPSWSQSK